MASISESGKGQRLNRVSTEVTGMHVHSFSASFPSIMPIYDKPDDDIKQIPQTTNNNVFIGSTSDLQRMLLKKDDEEKVVDINDYKSDE